MNNLWKFAEANFTQVEKSSPYLNIYICNKCWAETLSFLMNVHYHKFMYATGNGTAMRDERKQEKIHKTFYAKRGELIKKLFIALIMFSLKNFLEAEFSWHSWLSDQEENSFLLNYNYTVLVTNLFLLKSSPFFPKIHHSWRRALEFYVVVRIVS